MNHTESELRIMQEYENAVDEEVLAYVNKELHEDKDVITVGFLTVSAAEKIKELTGKEVYGNRIVLDKNGLRHIIERHGIEGKQDDTMRDKKDIARIGYVLANFDKIEFNDEYSKGYQDKNMKPAPKVIISKKIDGIAYVIEAVSDSKTKRNYIVSAYKKRKQWLVPDNEYTPGKTSET